MDGKYEELEKRVKNLEEMLKGFLQSEGNEIHIQLDHCQGDLIVGDNCDINLSHCEVNQLENRMDDAENRAEQLKSTLD